MRSAFLFRLPPAVVVVTALVLLPGGLSAQDTTEPDTPRVNVAADSAGIPAPEEEIPEQTEPDETALPDVSPSIHTFTEILLSEGAVTATDVEGNEWRFDFSRDTWVEGPGGTEGRGLADRNLIRDDLPIDLRATQLREVRPFEQSVTVGYDEYVEGDILASGRVTIKGWVKGDVRSINRRVLIAESGRVDGDVEAPSVVVSPGGEVLGKIRETGVPLDVTELTEAISVDAIVVVTGIAFVLMFVGFLGVAVIPKPIGRFDACISRHSVRCYALGFLLVVLLPVVIILCIITLVGVLLAPFVPLVYLAAIALGFISFAGRIGGWVLQKLAQTRSGPQVRTFVGLALHTCLWLTVILLLGQDSSLLLGLGYALLVAAIGITSYPLFTGVGAALLTRFGIRNYVSWRDRHIPDEVPPAPAPPPLHDPPPIVTPGPVPPPPAPSERVD